ncbi:hypothetical protein J2858_001662 [Neorhizobium galegae]|uniref:hypothetical protein n=1 Tax=Neorhizobium galegae TaxID=399 RepID=UPI001AE4E52F|nr:hypothetical protein [Neorhizobium galegae]MBP2548746.1 hypothetical protein [Neorhizobium galegae]
MLRKTILLASLAFSTSAAADQPAQDPMKVFENYAVFVVANANCLGLNFNVDNLQVELFNLGGAMKWSATRSRQQAEARVAASTIAYGQNPQAFCSMARSLVSHHGAWQLQSAGLLYRS